jgi:hypothetical protein
MRACGAGSRISTRSGETFETRVVGMDERGDQALCTIRIHARGRASGVVIDGELYHLVEFRNGLVSRLDAFREREDALRTFDAT